MMAQTTFHADLLSSVFPFNFKELGSTIVMPQPGEGPMQTPAGLHGNGAEQQAGYCQGFYLENVMPTARGYASVAYTKLSAGPIVEPMDNIVEVRTENNSLLQVGVYGAQVYIALDDGIWKVSTIQRDPTVTPQVAVVKGVSYLWFGTYVVYKFDTATQDFVLLNIAALDSITIKGISSGGAQLIIHDDDTVYYSSVFDATDFAPSIATGAGSTKVLALRGSILCCVALASDFVIYTQYNAIHARTTGNLQFPFNYKEIDGSLGAARLSHIAHQSNTGIHVVYTTAGFQQISSKGAEYIWPELSDGITIGTLPSIAPVTDVPMLTDYNGLQVKMAYIADRWICVSLGADPKQITFSDCFIFDTALSRWGRLKVDHTCIFQWSIELQEYTGAVTSYQSLQDLYPTYDTMEGLNPVKLYLDLTSITVGNAALTKNRAALVTASGNISAFTINGTDITGDTSNNGGTNATMPRLILGKYKISRNHGLVFQWLRCNKLKVGKVVLHGHDYNGDFIRRRDTLKESPRHKDTWYANLSADAVSVEFQGVFTVTDLTVNCTDAGTMNSYATPIKKFHRFLFSNIYPIETYETDQVHASYSFTRAAQRPTAFTEPTELGALYGLVGGTLLEAVVYVPLSVVEPTEIQSSYALVSGLQKEDVVYINTAVQEPGELQVSAYNLTAGSLVVTVRYIDITALELQEVQASNYSLISGSLV